MKTDFDPYRTCEDHCTHDLARGLLLRELDEEGPLSSIPAVVRQLFESFRRSLQGTTQ